MSHFINKKKFVKHNLITKCNVTIDKGLMIGKIYPMTTYNFEKERLRENSVGGILTTSELDWSNFGIPFPYEVDKQARELVRRLEKNENLKQLELLGLQNYTEMKVKMQHLSDRDPILNGWNLECWKLVMKYWKRADVILIGGGQRSSKSSLAGRIVVELAKQKAEAKIRCFHETEDRSIEDQQTFVEQALPMTYNDVPIKDSLKLKGKNFNIGYKQGSGFVGNKLILPPIYPMQERGSEIIFNNYQQWVNKRKIFEGMEADLIWGDEQMPFELFKTLLSRLASRKGKILLTFTMIDGFTDLVQSILGDSETLETRYSDVMKETLPVVQKSNIWPRTYIINFWSQDNPFFEFEDLRRVIEPQGRGAMLTKLFGIPEKKTLCQFPKFHPDIHVVKHLEVPTAGVTRYHIMDPAGDKNYAMIWALIDNNNDMYIYREWPNMKMSRFMNKLDGKYNGLGEWALPGSEGTNKNKGLPGPAQKQIGMGFERYAQIIEQMENGDEPIRRTKEELEKDPDLPVREVIFERFIDPRFASKTSTTSEGSETMIQAFMKQGLFFKKPKTGKDIEVGLMAINSLFDYDTSKEVIKDRTKVDGNRPKLYISSDCKNVISCIQNYTGFGGQEEYAKDFIDLIRYWVLSSPVYISKDFKRMTGSGKAVY